MTQQNDKKAVFGWVIYDWGNSAFATTVMAGFFPIFFKQYWSADADVTLSTARLGLANALAGLFVAVLAPGLGAIADRGTFKKNFLFLFTLLGVAATAALYFVDQGDWANAALFFACANIGFSGGLIFYDALLTSVASEDRMHMVSAQGYAYGYLGGGSLFALNVWMTLSPATFGLADNAEAVRLSFLSVAVWWAIFSIPLFMLVKESSAPNAERSFQMIRAGMRQLHATLREIRHQKTLGLFLIAYWFYIDGVGTVIRMAVDYGMSIGFETSDLIAALLITQFIGLPAALVFGHLGNRIGAKRSIFIGIAIYLFISIGGAFMKTRVEFWTLAMLIGLAQGGIQSLSRSYYALLIPPNKSAEYFGFYNMLSKFAAVLGPAIMGIVPLIVRHLGYSADTATRAGIIAIVPLFLIGAVLLYLVDEEKARRERAYLSQITA